MACPLLSIQNLSVSVGDQEIIHGFSLDVARGEIHAIMGPNGSGKSTLVHTLMGHPAYTVTGGSVLFAGKDLFALESHERAQKGLFLSFQYPRAIAGVSLRSFLFAAYNAQMAVRNSKEKKVSPIQFKKFLLAKMKELAMEPVFAERPLHQGFSGGEKKKAEILQLAVLKPLLALLDEADSGLDIDALKTVSQVIESMRSPDFSALLVTHYARILEYVTPDRVHVMVKGVIVESGGLKLALHLEKEGYTKYGVQEAS